MPSSSREVLKKINDAKVALMGIEARIAELPYPANSGVRVHLLELSTNVRLTALEIDLISLRLELISTKSTRLELELMGIRGVFNSCLWWRKTQVLMEMGSLLERQNSLDGLLDCHRALIPLFESKLTLLG